MIFYDENEYLNFVLQSKYRNKKERSNFGCTLLVVKYPTFIHYFDCILFNNIQACIPLLSLCTLLKMNIFHIFSLFQTKKAEIMKGKVL